MKTLLAASLLALASACTADTSDPPPTEAAPVDVVQAALRDVDVGHDLANAKATLERAVREGTVAEQNRDDVDIAIAVASRGLGDEEHAVSTLEALIARRGRSDWPRQEDASRLLVKWLTGKDRAPAPKRVNLDALPVAPIAHPLAKTIPRPSKDRVEINLARFGGDGTSEMLGTFRLDDALRLERQEECPLCERDLSTHTSRSDYGDWTGIAVQAEQLGSTLAVFYYDLESNQIPSRYDAYLPMPSAEIEARLKTGKGFYAVKERTGAPAIVLIAAPRNAQLATVEQKLAVATELPKTPVDVVVPAGLLPREIQASVRGSFGALKACYEAIPEPRPSGKFELSFAIDGAGKVKGATAGDATTLRVPAFTTCMLEAVGKITFGVTGKSEDTTVRYPIEFTPD